MSIRSHTLDMEDRADLYQVPDNSAKPEGRPLRKPYVALVCLALLVFAVLAFPGDVQMIRSLQVASGYPGGLFGRNNQKTLAANEFLDDGNGNGDDHNNTTRSTSLITPRPEGQDAETASVTTSSSSAKKNDTLQIAWLMSFPNSGTSFTGHYVRMLSMTYSGTNYGHENTKIETGTSIPIFPDQPEGPFWMDPSLYPEFSFPKTFVMVKTHCGGRCETCPPSQYAETMYSFRQKCLSGNRRAVVDGEFVDDKVSYPPDRVKKAIHLVRDPFDNVVSRFHLEIKGGRSGSRFGSSREGFRGYCAYLNNRFKEDEKRSILFDEELLALMEKIPCAADFGRYVEWHNQAFTLTRDLGIDTFVLFYDEYSTHMEEVTKRLMDFLALTPRGEIHEFSSGKTYESYYTQAERRAVREVMMRMATTETWNHIQKYFDEENSATKET